MTYRAMAGWLLVMAMQIGPIFAGVVHRQSLSGGTTLEAAGNDLLGYAVAQEGDVLVAGAFSDDIEIVPGQGEAGNVGSVYIFRRNGNLWSFEQRLIAPDAQGAAFFGIDVAISGNRIAVGARQQDTMAQGGGPLLEDQGAVYVYRSNAGQWTLEQLVVPPPGLGALAQFGWALDLHGDTLAVGAPDAGEGAVDVYEFQTGSGNWSFQQRLTRPTGTGFGGPNAFGRALSLDGNNLLVGAPLEDNPPISHSDAGAAYVFVRAQALWTLQTRLSPATAVSGAFFGSSVALQDNLALLGSPDETVSNLPSAGSVDAFTRVAGQWSTAQRWADPAPTAQARFGQAIALTGTHAMVAAYWAAGQSGMQEGQVQLFEGAGAAWRPTQRVQSPAATRAAFNQFGTDVASDGQWLVVGEPGFDRLANNDGLVQVFGFDPDLVFANGFD